MFLHLQTNAASNVYTKQIQAMHKCKSLCALIMQSLLIETNEKKTFFFYFFAAVETIQLIIMLKKQLI